MKLLDRRAKTLLKEVGELNKLFYFINDKDETLEEIIPDQYLAGVEHNKIYNIGIVKFYVEGEGESTFTFKCPKYQWEAILYDLEKNEGVDIVFTSYTDTPNYKIIKEL